MTKKTWFGVIIIVIFSIIMALLVPVNEVFKGIVSLPAVGGLFFLLSQLLRDENHYQRKRELQNEQQLFNLGSTSHMANRVFDKHVEFCEEYLKIVHELLSTLYQEGPTKLVLVYSKKLYQLRMTYTAWITPEIDEKLIPFENSIREIGSTKEFIEALRPNEKAEKQRLKAINDMYIKFSELMNLNQNEDHKDEESFIIIKEKVREILQVNKLTEIRESLVNKAYEDARKNSFL